jgi:hypothetical protein
VPSLVSLGGTPPPPPPIATRGHLLAALNENGPNCLLARGLTGGDVENLLRGLRLVTAELMHQGSIVSARPEHRNDISVADLGEFVTLSGETRDVVPQGFAMLLSATLQIPRIAEPHVCALKVAGKDILEIFPTINQVSRQVIEPGSRRLGQVNGEELDDKKVNVCPVRPIRKSVVLQPNIGISLAIIHGDVAGRLETFREARVTHVAPERFGPQPLVSCVHGA